MFLSGTDKLTIDYLDIGREQFLEYDLAEAIVKLNQKVKPKLGLYSSLPVKLESFDPSQRFNHQQREWTFVSSLRKSFEINFLEDDQFRNTEEPRRSRASSSKGVK